MRILLTGLAALALAGCQSPAPADPGPQPDEAAVEAELQNAQFNQALAIENAARADEANLVVNDE